MSEGLKRARAAARATRTPVKSKCDHDWTPWKSIGRTGDWFKPHICRRECTKCKETQTEDM